MNGTQTTIGEYGLVYKFLCTQTEETQNWLHLYRHQEKQNWRVVAIYIIY